FTKAANGGDADAQMYLSLAYYYGEGTEQNLTEAYKWAQKAEAQGHEDAEALLKKINCNIASPDTESLNK
ncbi:MAG: sel1 repeat family protein, partial [Akkermansia sp.]|nr:sel1 repeat family protein [Akkermansia sp.]